MAHLHCPIILGALPTRGTLGELAERWRRAPATANHIRLRGFIAIETILSVITLDCMDVWPQMTEEEASKLPLPFLMRLRKSWEALTRALHSLESLKAELEVEKTNFELQSIRIHESCVSGPFGCTQARVYALQRLYYKQIPDAMAAIQALRPFLGNVSAPRISIVGIAARDSLINFYGRNSDHLPIMIEEMLEVQL
jgi:hypothetical protein